MCEVRIELRTDCVIKSNDFNAPRWVFANEIPSEKLSPNQQRRQISRRSRGRKQTLTLGYVEESDLNSESLEAENIAEKCESLPLLWAVFVDHSPPLCGGAQEALREIRMLLMFNVPGLCSHHQQLSRPICSATTTIILQPTAAACRRSVYKFL